MYSKMVSSSQVALRVYCAAACAALSLLDGCSSTPPPADLAAATTAKPVAPKPKVATPARPGPTARLQRALELERNNDDDAQSEAAGIYEELCRSGRAAGCYHLDGLMRTTGMSSASQAPSPAHFLELCKRNDLRACMMAGLRLDDDGGMPRDGEQAFELFVKSCEGGYAYACSRVATFYLVSVPSQQPDAPQKALQYAWRACKAGYAAPCWLLATQAKRDESLPSVVPSTERVLDMACERGSTAACDRIVDLTIAELPFACDQCGWRQDVKCGDCKLRAEAREVCCPTCPDRDRSALCADIEMIKEHRLTTPSEPAETIQARKDRIRRAREPLAQMLSASCELGHLGACVDLAELIGQVPHYSSAASNPARALELHRRACKGGNASGCAKVASAKGVSTPEAQKARDKALALAAAECRRGIGGSCWLRLSLERDDQEAVDQP